MSSPYGDGPWEGAAKFVRVADRDDVGTVVQAGKNFGTVYCYVLLFESTGEVAFYRVHDCVRCDRNGSTERAT